ncbi:GTPase [Metabacillus idriensis]|uniref:GTPase n=1 Tax=Metabacillus idriensis TaxID=324768 RepID=UPI002813CF50|nr:GTPase [Metabacillus idriensis]MDR0140313.1 GTPase [Metabacillus idriensis]
MTISIRDKDLSKNTYIKQLVECGLIAEQQAEALLTKKLPRVEKILSESRKNLNEFIKTATLNEDFTDSELEKNLLELTESINSQLKIGHQHMKDSLTKKQEHLKNFTVTLFGRTKAGKSTIREALTYGDGLSIGNGLQRTTRDNKEYIWNQLRIIDTPGIAAYEGDEDVIVAESVIDETDVILFLCTTDGIQEAEFQKLTELKSMNKPIIILLNVKVDITNNLRRKRFLSNWEEIVSEKGQAGHFKRIRTYTKEYFGPHKVQIIPIHAQAAFLSTQEQDENNSLELYNSSRLEQLKDILQRIVINEGVQHRIKTFHDAHIFYLNSLSNVYWEAFKKIKPRVSYLGKKFRKLSSWFNKFSEEGQYLIENRVKEVFAPIYSDIGNFVDEYAGKKDADIYWKKKMETYEVQNKIESICTDLEKELHEYLKEFSRQLNFEIQAINFEDHSYGINNVSKGVMGRVTRWGGAALGVAEGALIINSLVNFWNPAGWIMGTIGIAAIAVNIFGWIFGDDTKRYEKEKDKVKNKMTLELQKKEIEIKKELKAWFNSQIILPVRKKSFRQVTSSIGIMERLLLELEKESKAIDDEILFENRDLIAELYYQSFGENIKEKLSSIAREQGHLTKILYKDVNPIFDFRRRKYLENILGERVISVEFYPDPIELFRRAMFPARVELNQIEYESKGHKFIIKTSKDEIGKIIGKKGRHIKTTSNLLNCNIQVLEV